MKIHKNIEQKSDEWFELRRGCITGSKLADIIPKRGTARKIGSYKIIAERIGIDDGSDFSSGIERGNALEGEAREAFTKATGIEVYEVGFLTSDENEKIGYSPDGVIPNDKGKLTGGIEIKCLSGANHIKAIIEDKIPDTYMLQVYQAFIVNGDLQKLYFVLYEPRLTAKPLHIIEIEREDIFEEIEFARDYQLKELKWIDKMVHDLTF